ncbi:MAG: 30S ribosomal protein S18 [Mycoplasmataceae bacterium]|jgi:small subunit ribosomal protein S18|nr:30S ribosomal protein S18 [Mycoplasmataceae bacterium]
MINKDNSKIKSNTKHHCYFCVSGTNFIDHKNVELLNRFIAYNGKIKPRRISNVCAKHQRMVSNAIKRARLIALLPFVKE